MRQPEHGDGLRRAFEVLGLEPGVSPLRARHRYRQLLRDWHPDRHAKDPSSQASATLRTQEITEAYRRAREAALHGEVPLRRPRGWQPEATAHSPAPSVDTAVDRAFRFAGGALVGLVLDFFVLADSAMVWIAIPIGTGTFVALFGWGILDWTLRKLWWLA